MDAVIRVDKLVPVDAKFPLDNFERLVDAQDDESRQLHEKAFARDVKIHIDAIESKYIRPDEGTYDFALMYLPRRRSTTSSPAGRPARCSPTRTSATSSRSRPNTFVAYLQMIVLGLKGMQIEQHAQEVMAYCAQLQKDFGTFRSDFDTIGKHLGHARSKYAEAERRLDRFESSWTARPSRRRLETVEMAELPRALDAA